MDFLEYSDIYSESKGSMAPGKLKLTDQHIIFKNQKTGKVEQISSSDVENVSSLKLVGSWGIRLFLKNGTLHRFGGFKDGEQEKIGSFFKKNYKQDMLEKDLSLKGWNWGTAKFLGSVLSFDIGNLTAFEVPLSNVGQCTTGKNEVTLEFHQNDDAPVSLMEMRYHIPSSELAGEDPVDQFLQQVMDKASVISATGDAIAIFREIQCLTPRGRYDIKVFQSFFQLHGKTFDYKIPMSTVLRLFLLPHKDGRQMFFVVSLDPPIKQGQTRYHFLVFLFGPDEETQMELPFTDEELKEKYDGRLTKDLQGPTCEVLSKVMKALVNRKITMPGQFMGHSGTPAVGCSYKAAAGYMYPLERGFIYIHKPPVHIRFEEINSVNFARSGGSTRSFDFEVETKSGVQHTFSSIEKEEYGKLFDFINNKKLRVKNRGKTDKPTYTDDFGDSDQEGEPDAYLARVKREAQERDDDDGGSSDESEDEDFKPPEDVSDVAEEYDSNPSTSDDSDEEGSGGGGGGSGDEKKKKKKEKKAKTAKTVSEKPRRQRRSKKDKNVDPLKPKRPSTAFMLWLNATRESIKSKYPGIAPTEVAKKGGEMWRELTDKSEWEAKAAEAKAEYDKAMKEYKENGGGAEESSKSSKGEKSSKSEKSEKSSKSSSPSKAVSSPTKLGSGGNYKSKEYLSDDSSSDEEKSKKRSGKGSEKSAKSKKVKKEPESEEEEEPKSKKVKKEPESEEEEEESGASSEEEKKSKKPAKKTEKKEKKQVKKEAKSSDDEELEDEEEILSSPTASSDSDSD